MLTRKQYTLLKLIDERLKMTGVAPSFEEMKTALDLKSKSGVHRLITALEERGFLRRLPNRARALEVLKMPEVGAVSPQQTARAGFKPNVIDGTFRLGGRRNTIPRESDMRNPAPEDTGEAMPLPLYGRIAAGTPIEALRDPDGTATVPAAMIGSGDHYALTVDGDSMIDAGIFDGDTVVIRRCDTAENGAIVVALVDEQEVTLKRLRRRGASVALEPANPRYETRICGPDQVKVQGRLVGLLRHY